jgi:hypothetical protein
MRLYLRSRRDPGTAQGTALAVAMLVIVMLSAIGVVAVNAASYDAASAGAVSQQYSLSAVSGGGVALTRCKMCESIDGIVLAMQSARVKQGKAPRLDIQTADLLEGLDDAELLVDPPGTAADTPRGTFGNVFQAGVADVPPVLVVTMDRPRESGVIAGYSLRESAGSDSGALCFRSYRVTSVGSVVPPRGDPLSPIKSQQRAFIVAGPLECSN